MGSVRATENDDLAPLRLEMSRIRNERGLTYEQLAERSGLSRSAVIRMETGESAGSMRGWWAVARGLDVPLSVLVSVLDGGPGRSPENGPDGGDN